MKSFLFTPWKAQAIAESSPDFEWQTRRLSGLKIINQEPSSWNFCGYAIRIIPPVRIGDSLFQHGDGHCISIRPRYQVGDIVYIKEAWATEAQYNHLKPSDIPDTAKIHYVSDGVGEWPLNLSIGRWRSPLFMPEWAARYFIKITNVRPERLKDIMEEDAIAEGCKARKWGIWWQGYKDMPLADGKELLHTEYEGLNPPEWMIEPHKMAGRPWLDRTATHEFQSLWDSINKTYPFDGNYWVWRICFNLIEDKGSTAEMRR